MMPAPNMHPRPQLANNLGQNTFLRSMPTAPGTGPSHAQNSKNNKARKERLPTITSWYFCNADPLPVTAA